MANQHVTIEVLPNEILLHIFLCHRLLSLDYYDTLIVSCLWKWHVLAHVCRRWRHLIFMSPHHLTLRLILGRKHKTTMDCWPALPILLEYDIDRAPDADDKESFFAALKHHDRIYEMHLITSSWMFGRSTAWVEWPFPELQCLDLTSSFIDDGYLTVLPSTFLTGSTSTPNQLRHIHLRKISVPALPQLLVRSRNLISLSLGPSFLAGERFPSPEALVAALSGATQLRLLDLHDDSSMPHPEQGSAQPPQDLTGLPNLITLTFMGSVEYMEDLVSRIHAPLVENLKFFVSVSFSQQSIVGVPQLSEFISRTKELSSLPSGTSICLSHRAFSIEHRFGDSPPQSFERKNSLSLVCCDVSWEMSPVTHILRQSSPFMSSLKRLYVTADGPHLDPTSWLQFFGCFNGVEILGVWGDESRVREIVDALKQCSSTEVAPEVLPALRIFELHDDYPWTHWHYFPELLVAMRERPGQPLEINSGWSESSDSESCSE